MTKKFDNLYKKLMENMMSVDVLGTNSDKPYDTTDVRTPKVLGIRKRKKRVK
jgi:hypothetical protein